VASRIQKVIVIPLGNEPMKSLKNASLRLHDEIGGITSWIADCGSEPNCVGDLKHLRRAFSELLEWWNATSLPRGQDALRAAVRQGLEAAAAHVDQADALLQQANADEAQRATLPDEAVGHLDATGEQLVQIGSMAGADDAAPNSPLCGLLPAAVMMCLIICVAAGRRLVRAVGEAKRPRR
jgi:hypothetical protein